VGWVEYPDIIGRRFGPHNEDLAVGSCFILLINRDLVRDVEDGERSVGRFKYRCPKPGTGRCTDDLAADAQSGQDRAHPPLLSPVVLIIDLFESVEE